MSGVGDFAYDFLVLTFKDKCDTMERPEIAYTGCFWANLKGRRGRAMSTGAILSMNDYLGRRERRIYRRLLSGRIWDVLTVVVFQGDGVWDVVANYKPRGEGPESAAAHLRSSIIGNRDYKELACKIAKFREDDAGIYVGCRVPGTQKVIVVASGCRAKRLEAQIAMLETLSAAVAYHKEAVVA